MASSPSRRGAPPVGSERRVHPRVSASLPFAAELDGRLVHIETDNLSEGGAYCRSDVRFPVMTRMDVSLELPVGAGREDEDVDSLVRLQAVVVRCDPHPEASGSWSLALFFPAPDPDVRQRLASYVRGRRAAVADDASGPDFS